MQEDSPLLTLQNVERALHCLTIGSSNIKEAEGALLSWQKHQVNDYAQALLFATLNPQVRLAALLSLKAVVKQSWKDRGRSQRQFLDETTKAQMRHVLLALVTSGEHPLVQHESIDEQYRRQYNVESVVNDRTVQAAASSCLVLVAVFDLPKQSQDLIPLLISYAMSPQKVLVQNRNALYVLEGILEELSQKRLLGVKQYVQIVAVNHIVLLSQEGFRLVNLLLVDNALDSTLFESCTLLVHIIHYLLQTSLSAVLECPGDVTAAVDQWMKLVLDVSSASLSDGQGLQLCKSLWELVVDIQEAHPIAFGRYLEPFLHMFYNMILVGFDGTNALNDPRVFLAYYEERISQASPFPNELTILALRFLANVASCSQYIPDETKNEAVPVIQSELGFARTNITSKGDVQLRPSDVQNAVHVVWSAFFSNERACNLADICVCHLMTMSPESVSEWETDPEGYLLAEEHRSAEDNVQLAAQVLFCSLVESMVARPIVLPRLVALLNDRDSQMNACRQEAFLVPREGGNMNGVHPIVLLWDAVYTAAGLSTSVLEEFDGWDFQTWYCETLGPCLDLLTSNNSNGQALPVFRRRIIWLIGCNTSRLSVDSSAFSSMVKVITTTTSVGNDIAVKLSAVQVISNMLSNFDEAAGESIMHAEVIVGSLYRLAGDCDEIDSHSIILDAIPLLLLYIVGNGRDITLEVANAAVSPLSNIWDASCGERVLLRRSIIAILVVVISSLGPTGVDSLLPIVIPIIASSLDSRTRTEHSFLVEEALVLWLTILRFTGAYTPEVGDLIPMAVGLLDVDFEYLRLIMMIFEMSIMLGGQTFLAAHADSLCKCLCLTLTKVRPRGAKYVALVLEALLREFPLDGGLLLLRCGILQTMVRACAMSWSNSEESEPQQVVSLYLNSLARVLFISSGILDKVLPLQDAGCSFGYKELLQIYIKLLSEEVSEFSKSLWMKFLVSLLPGRPEPVESQLSAAFADSTAVMDEVLVRCKDVLTKRSPLHVPEYYQLEYESDEETFDAGYDRYEATVSRVSLFKDALGAMNLQEQVAERVTFLCKSPDAKCQAVRDAIDPKVLASLNQAVQ